METSLKTGFAQIFSCCPQKSELLKIGGGEAAALLTPPASTPQLRHLLELEPPAQGSILGTVPFY